jgi:membrane-anchored protein YejM (alkaline phosphatase superfamily)
MTRTLQQLKESVERLIEEQGNDAPVAAFIFTNEDVFVMDEDNNPDPVQREIAETVLHNVEEYDHIFTEIFNTIEQELKEVQ